MQAGAPVEIVIRWDTDPIVPVIIDAAFNLRMLITVTGGLWEVSNGCQRQTGILDLFDATALHHAVELGIPLTNRNRDQLVQRYAPGSSPLESVESPTAPTELLNAARTNPAHLLNGLTNRQLGPLTLVTNL